MTKTIEEILKKYEIEDSGKKSEKLTAYMDGILEWNEHVNLTAVTDKESFIQKHYADSLLCVDSPEFLRAESVIDIGTGGGFPGVPLAVAFPDKSFTLIDSLGKRIRIIDELVEAAGICNVKALHGRAEELARRKDMRESFDLCVSRAVANMRTLAEYCLPFVKTGGCFVAYKGPDCEEELKSAEKAISLLGGRVMRKEQPADQAGGMEHTLIYIMKERPTPSKYPRKPGTPAKDPI